MDQENGTAWTAGDDRVEPADAPPDWLVRIVNPVLKAVLRSPLHGFVSEHLLLLTVTGRKTGTEYTFPVAYERDGRTVYVTSHGTNWWKNLRGDGQRVTVRVQGERVRGHATVEEDNPAVAEHVRDYLRRNGTNAARRVGLDVPGNGVPSRETLEAAVDHVVAVTIELDEYPRSDGET
jgi:hypothetical protein